MESRANKAEHEAIWIVGKVETIENPNLDLGWNTTCGV